MAQRNVSRLIWRAALVAVALFAVVAYAYGMRRHIVDVSELAAAFRALDTKIDRVGAGIERLGCAITALRGENCENPQP